MAPESLPRPVSTVPVAQTKDGASGWTIRFFMPHEYTMATLPVPNDGQIRLVAVPSATYAVLRFTGSTGAVAARRGDL
jgi:hypothetical protein